MRSRFWISFACLIILPLFVVASAVIAIIGGWTIRSRLDSIIILGSAGWILAVISGTTLRKAREWLARSTLHIFTLFAIVVFALCIGELALHFVIPIPAKFHLRSPNQHAVFKPNSSFLSGVTGTSDFTTNTQGVRGSEMPDDPAAYKILCVGGSTTECLYLDDNETWPALLMKRLNESGLPRRCWVGNAGVSGFGAAHHLRFLTDSDLVDSVDCVVLMMGINDLAAYTIDHPNESRGRAPIWARLNLLKVIRQRGVLDSVTVEDVAGANYQQRRRIRQRWDKTDEMPDLSIPLSDYHGRIESIAAICRQRHIDVVFVTQPVLWTKDISPECEARLWKVIAYNKKCLSAARSRDVMDEFNNALLETSARLDFPCIDLNALSGTPSYYYDDAHFNEEGAQSVAKAIADWFLTHSLLETTTGSD